MSVILRTPELKAHAGYFPAVNYLNLAGVVRLFQYLVERTIEMGGCKASPLVASR